MKEEWREIEGYEELYEISNIGRVKSLLFNREKILNLIMHSQGYHRVKLSKYNKPTHFLVHRLVGGAFILNTLNKPEINHKNGIKTDNRVSNLEWVTHKENLEHAANNNLLKPIRGEKHGMSKLNELQVRIIRRLMGEITKREMALIFNVGATTIGDIINKKKWKHLNFYTN